jgi:hypothetical protein
LITSKKNDLFTKNNEKKNDHNRSKGKDHDESEEDENEENFDDDYNLPLTITLIGGGSSSCA